MSVAVRYARCEAPKRTEASFEVYARKGSLESDVRSKDSCVVRRGAIGKVPIEVTRWWPTLLHAPLCVQERPMYPVGDRPTGAKPRAP